MCERIGAGRISRIEAKTQTVDFLRHELLRPIFFHAPLNAWELDGMPSMEGEADLFFASSISRFFILLKSASSADGLFVRRGRRFSADGGNSKNQLLNPMR